MKTREVIKLESRFHFALVKMKNETTGDKTKDRRPKRSTINKKF